HPTSSTSPWRPSTAPEPTEKPAKAIEDQYHLVAGQPKALSSANPRKRTAGPGSASPEPLPPGGLAATTQQSRVKHTKALSIGQAIDKDPDFQREQKSTVNPGSQRRLFDHRNDDPGNSNLPRKQRVPGTLHRNHLPSQKLQNTQITEALPYGSMKHDVSRLPTHQNIGIAGPQILQPKPNNLSRPVELERPSDPKPQDALVDEPDDVDELEKPDDPEPDTSMLRQPDTRAISHDQLVVEVKGIYAGLVMVEAKCIDVDEKQTVTAPGEDLSKRAPLTHDQWRSLIALHKQLLHEHHDFFLASQHPASSSLSKLAAKYSMPARMWRHGIHAFLEVLRHRLPDSLEHMLAFIYIAYSMMALLYETVPTFEDTWIECLGDLGRYRMAIEDDEPSDREVWSGVSKYWYSKASDKSPHVGRLYHHLAILARPYTLEQLSLYTRSLTCVIPFENARGSIMTLLNPILAGRTSAYHRAPLMETLTIKAHAVLFTYPQRSLDEFQLALKQLKDSVIADFVGDLPHNEHKLRRVATYLAVSNTSAMFEYGALTANGRPRSLLRQSFEAANVKKAEATASTEAISSSDAVMRNADDVAGTPGKPGLYKPTATADEAETSSIIVAHASDLTFSTFLIMIDKIYQGPKYLTHLLPFVHVMMVFIWSSALVEDAIKHFEKDVPWAAVCLYLNGLITHNTCARTLKVYEENFPKPDVGFGRPLWEDFILRGLVYTLWYFPEGWFTDAGIDDEERQLEVPSMDAARIQRILWLGHRIASVCLGKWISYNIKTKSFEITQYIEQYSNAPGTESIIHQNSLAARPKDPDSVMADPPMSNIASTET
ncbi:MAG: hypothetical protein Q9163_005636, partial [Psora crenata]